MEYKDDGSYVAYFLIAICIIAVISFWGGRQTMRNDLREKENIIRHLQQGGCTDVCFTQIETGRRVIGRIGL